MYESKKKYFYGTGRRKSSVARVRVYENGTGAITINSVSSKFCAQIPMLKHNVLPCTIIQCI